MTPIVDSITVTPPSGPAGTPFVVKIIAHDPAGQTYVGVGSASDAAGNKGSLTFTFVAEAPIAAYGVELPSNVVVTPRAGEPGVFDCVAPA